MRLVQWQVCPELELHPCRLHLPCSVEGSSLGSASFHLTSTSIPPTSSPWDSTGLDCFPPSECNLLQPSMVLAVHTTAPPPSHYYWPCGSQPLPSHQPACKHVLHTCRAAVTHPLLCDEEINAHHATAVHQVCIRQGQLCSGTASQSDPDSSHSSRLTC
jgi:hypothetical protein